MLVITNKRNGNQVLIMQEDFEKMKRVAKFFAQKDVKKEFVIMVF